ncbi:hypothetical protein C0993_006732 [Termitomyces sp. T159_Od127]|nr:hypothetical protein C0993_006732 [Termitomyces sp. T159_Od127]
MALARGHKDGGVAGKEQEVFQDQPHGPLAIWTTGIWQRDSRVMRWGEQKLVDVVRRWTHDSDHLDTSRFIKDVATPEVQSLKRRHMLTAFLETNRPANTDGWNVYRSDSVTIKDSIINNGDDCVAFKPSKFS